MRTIKQAREEFRKSFNEFCQANRGRFPTNKDVAKMISTIMDDIWTPDAETPYTELPPANFPSDEYRCIFLNILWVYRRFHKSSGRHATQSTGFLFAEMATDRKSRKGAHGRRRV